MIFFMGLAIGSVLTIIVNYFLIIFFIKKGTKNDFFYRQLRKDTE